MFLILGLSKAGATEYVWIGFNSPNWNDPVNWANLTIPLVPLLDEGYPGSSGTSDIADIGTYANLATLLNALLGPLTGKTYSQPVLNVNATIATLNFGPYNYSTGANDYLTFSNSTLTVNSAFNVGSIGVCNVYFTGTGAVAGTSAMTMYNGSLINTVSGVSLTCGNTSIPQSNATLTLSGKYTCSGNFSVSTSITGNTLTTNASSNAIGGLQLATGSVLTWGGTSGCSTTVNAPSTLNASGSTAATLNVTSGNNVNFISSVSLSAATPTTGTINFNNSGAVTFTSTTLTTSGPSTSGATITNKGGALNFYTSTFTAGSGIINTLTNTNNTSPTVTGTCLLDKTTVNNTGTLNITNAGTFTANDGSIINFSAGSTTGTISNSGTFYAGQSASSCYINCNAPCVISNPGGTFYVGSTSYINPNYATAYIYNGSGTLSSGSLTSPGTFTFQSDVNGSAQLGAIPATAAAGTILGTFIIQRFVQGTNTGTTGGTAVPARRNYRLFSSPVNTNIISGSFKNMLQNSTAFTNSNNYSGASGTFCLDLRYILAGTLVNGNTTNNFDKVGNPTLYFYRDDYGPSFTTFTGGPFKGVTAISTTSPYTTGIGEVNNSYVITSTANYQVPIGNGYMVFFRGDRTNVIQKLSATTGPNYVNDATFQATGFINQGQITVQHWLNSNSTNATLLKSSATGNNYLGLNLVGNPYPCTINIDYYNNTGITSTNLSGTIYVLNPISKTYDTYIPLASHTSSPTTVYTSATYPKASGSATNMIASGQGFYVQAGSGTAPTLTFNESAKVLLPSPGSGLILFNSQNPTAGTKSLQLNSQSATSAAISADPESWMRIKLVKDSLNMDDISIIFQKNATGKFDQTIDAYDMGGDGESVDLSSYSTDGTILAINTMPDLSNVDSIKLYVSGSTTGLYSLTFPIKNNLDPRYKIFLKDNFMKDSLDVTDYSNYGFNINRTDTNTFGSRRFVLMIHPKYGAYKLISFNGIKEPTDVKLTWNTQGETTYSVFTVQKSTDGGKTYDDIGTVQANDGGTYSLVDNNPVNGVNIYRLKQVDTYNDTTYSASVTIVYSSGTNASIFTVSPNPTADVLKINLNNTQAGNMKMTIYSMGGEIMQQHTFSGGTYSTSVSGMIHGVYVIQVVDAGTNYLIGRAKFIKL